MLSAKKWYFALILTVLAVSACTAGGAAEPTEPPITDEPTTEVTTPPTDAPTEAASDGVNDLAGTSWLLTQLNGAAPVEGTQITLTFDEATLGGQACNGYGGDYTASAGSITVGELISTMMACMEPAGVMEQEAAYTAALREVTQYSVSGDQLTLGSAANPTSLVYVASTPAATTPADGWTVYQDNAAGFTVSYPANTNPDGTVSSGPITNGTETAVRFDLPFTPDTNLSEKFMQIDVYPNTDVCVSPYAEGYADDMLNPGEVTIGDITWKTHTAGDAGAGNFYEWFAYSTSHNGNCVALTFVLHSLNAANFDPPATEFDRAAETAVFEQIVATFDWLQ